MKADLPADTVCSDTDCAPYASVHHTPVSAPANSGLRRLGLGRVAAASGRSAVAARAKRAAAAREGESVWSNNFTQPKFVPYTAWKREGTQVRVCKPWGQTINSKALKSSETEGS